ncbi:MAG TPA: SDR family oxidoreductase [Ktedonobacterales bacterium]|nr:SDR family oxidoreductase [Ktedonobacterales bacterium]
MANDTTMQGRVCLITGATMGIGRATAQALAEKGATLTIIGRNPQKVTATVAELRASSGNQAIEGLVADLSSQAEIRRVATEFQAQHDRLHVLINNAGAMFFSRRETVDGLEYTFALDHLAYFLLTNLLLDTLKASATPERNARIVSVSSTAHTGARINFDDLQGKKSYSAMGAYGQAKLANLLFTYELARRLAGTNVTANALHPGFVSSGFAMNNLGGPLRAVAHVVMRPLQINVEQGARTSVYLATSPDVEGVTGRYFDKCQAVKSSPASYDEEAAKRLWEISEQLVGLIAMV